MFAKRLRQLRKDKNLTQSALAKALGITQQAVAKWEGGLSVPDTAAVVRLCGFFNVSADYLVGAFGDTPDGILPYREPSARVPVIGFVRAGYNALADEDYQGIEPADVKDAREYCYFLVQGDSMEPYIHDQDLALVRIQPVLDNGDLGVVIHGEGEATLKKYHRKGDSVILKPFNPNYAPVILSGEELSRLYIFGKVIETKTRW